MSNGIDCKKSDLKPAVRYDQRFWTKLLHGRRISKNRNKFNNQTGTGNPNPRINSLLRKLSISEVSCTRKVTFYFIIFNVLLGFILGQTENNSVK